MNEDGQNIKKFIWRVLALLALILMLLSMFSGCPPKSPDEVEYLIGISQANMREPWRLVLMKEIQEEAKKYDNVRIVSTDATQNSDKQVSDIKRLLDYGVDLLIVSPCDAQKITPVVSDVYQSIPVVVLDRAVEGFDYSLFIGPDNTIIGKQAGEAVVELAAGERARVLEICGDTSAQATIDRSKGFSYVIGDYPGIQSMQISVPTEARDAAEEQVLKYGQELENIDIIFAHNDYMALGAYRAVMKLGHQDIKIVGIDGFTGEDGGLELVRRGIISETITCPTGGKEAVQYAMDILKEVSGVPKQVILRSHRVTKENLDEYQARLEAQPVKADRIIQVGYAQVGTESTFRIAANNSVKAAAKDEGINLLSLDADQDQERQIAAVREFIARGVDVIVISPVVETGWDEVLQEARDAGIPVLLSDRKIMVEDDSLVMSYIGADFIEEGRRAMKWLLEETKSQKKPIKIMELQGTKGASPTTERKQGFEDALLTAPGYSIVYSRGGDFTYEGGKRIVEEYLKEHEWEIDVIFSHNDDMALGAIEALEEHDINPGVDVKIISVDGTKPALTALQEGKINCVVECNPLLGPQLMKAVGDLTSGKELPLRIITDEKIFTKENINREIKNRNY